MSKIHIIDASAMLAYLQQEKGEDAVEAALDAGAAQATTVNTWIKTMPTKLKALFRLSDVERGAVTRSGAGFSMGSARSPRRVRAPHRIGHLSVT